MAALPSNQTKRIAWKQWVVPLALFLLAYGVRTPALGQFLTVDEPFWADRSRSFAAGLLFNDYKCPPLPRDGRQFAGQGWNCTFQTAHPGVTTMEAGSVGLLLHYWQAVRPTGVDLRTYLETLVTDPLDRTLIAPMRWPLVVMAALFIPIFYLLLKRLLSERVALLSAGLLALNPFHIALSRVLHQDALTATFMTLSLLALAGYWLRGWRWPWLLVSAGCAGLACLSKPVGWFMLPFAALVGGIGLWYRWQQGKVMGWSWLEVGRLSREGLIWGVGVGVTFFVLFPAMWTIPLEVLRTIFDVSANYSEAGHIDGHYFLGQISRDPGPLFYPVTWLWRTSPLELIGLAALLVSLGASVPRFGKTRKTLHQTNHPVLLILACFILMLFLFETLSSKKMDRYFLPAFPAIEVFAALGLLWLADYLAALISRFSLKPRLGSVPALHLIILAAIILLGQGGLVWANYPYYFTYYNPLLGGAPAAARLMTIFGWGEGMDQVAAYLNQQPDAASLQVVAGYEDTLKPFFAGQVIKARGAGEILAADYVVYYRNQLQRRLQDVDTWRYFEGHAYPSYRVTLQGLDYALVYQIPIQQRTSAADNSLPHTYTYGYNLDPTGILTLFWQNLGLDQPIWAGLTPAAGGETRWFPCQLNPAFTGEANIPGALLETQCNLAPAEAGPDLYDLRLGVGSEAAVMPIEFPAGRLALALDPAGHFGPVDQSTALAQLTEQALPPGALAVDVPLGQMARLAGYQLEADTWQPGRTAGLWLYWQSTQSLNLAQIADPFQLLVRLTPAGAAKPILATVQPLIPRDFTANLARGAIAPAHYTLALPASLPSTEYSLEVCAVTNRSGQALPGPTFDPATPVECLPLFVTRQKL